MYTRYGNTLVNLALPYPSISNRATPGEKVRYYRELKGISQNALGEALGISNWGIVNFEKGFNPIHYKNAVELAKALDVPTDELMDEYSRFCMPGYGERLKRIRIAHEMSQDEFSRILGVTRSTEAIWECEYEEIHPSREAFKRIKELAEDKDLDMNQLIKDPSVYIDDYERFIDDNCAKKVRYIRSAYGMHKQAFGQMVGCEGSSAVSLWESGKTKPMRKQFNAIRDAAETKGIDIKVLNENPDFYKDGYIRFTEKDCGQKIKHIRVSMGLLQREFAEKVGCAGNTISEWEYGNNLPTKPFYLAIRRIASEAGIDLDLLNDDPDEYRDRYEEFIQDGYEDRIRHIRHACGLSLRKFGQLVGVTCTAVCQWEDKEKYRRPCREAFERIIRIAEERGIDIYDS